MGKQRSRIGELSGRVSCEDGPTVWQKKTDRSPICGARSNERSAEVALARGWLASWAGRVVQGQGLVRGFASSTFVYTHNNRQRQEPARKNSRATSLREHTGSFRMHLSASQGSPLGSQFNTTQKGASKRATCEPRTFAPSCSLRFLGGEPLSPTSVCPFGGSGGPPGTFSLGRQLPIPSY